MSDMMNSNRPEDRRLGDEAAGTDGNTDGASGTVNTDKPAAGNNTDRTAADNNAANQFRLPEQMAEEIFEEVVIEEKSFRFEKHLKKILILCAILLTGEMLYFFIITPAMPLSKIEITGAEGLERSGISKSALLEYAGISSGTSYFGFNTEKIRQALLMIPRIESVRPEKKFPDAVRIALQLRKPAALSLASVNGHSEIVIYDRHGVIFETGNDPRLTIPASVPVISGIAFPKISAGMRLPDFLTPLLDDINLLQESNPGILSTLSEIRVNRRASDNFDLTLYPVHKKVRIRTQAGLKEDTLSYLLLLLDVLEERGVSLSELDFRTGTAVYTK